MIKQNLQKIKNLLKERNYIIPQILYKFYSFILLYSQAIQQKTQNNVLNMVSIYSDIFRLYKKYIVDQPFHLKKIMIQQIVEQDNNQGLIEIYKLRDQLQKQFKINNSNQIYQLIIDQMYDFKWAKQLRLYQKQIVKGEEIVKNKKQNNQVSQITNLIWIKEYKNQYIIKNQQFVEFFINFCKKYYKFLAFMNVNTKKILKELIDPDRRHFITKINIQDFMQKIRQPSIIKKIHDYTNQQIEQIPFKSNNKMKIKIFDSKNQKTELYEISGQKIISQNEQKAVKTPAVIMIGSSPDNQIIIKSKYISRRQMMIIQDPQIQAKYHFSIVCLSLTNTTGYINPTRFKCTVGLIFQIQTIKYQILNIQKDSLTQLLQAQQQKTLSILPSQNIPETNHQKISFLILNGINKQKQFSISSYNIYKVPKQQVEQYRISKLLEFNSHFYIKRGVKILMKGSNQILQNRISKKIKLIKDMQIPIQEFTITIL